MVYLPPEVELIKLLVNEYKWAKQFVRMKGIREESEKLLIEVKTVGTGPADLFEFDDVILVLGDLSMSDGGQLTVEYDIAAVPQWLEKDFEDIVKSQGDTFKRLRKAIDLMMSGFINALIDTKEEEPKSQIIVLPI